MSLSLLRSRSSALRPWARHCVVDICGKGRHPAKFWHCFDQNVLSCAVKVASEDVDARCIAVWPRQGVDEAGPKQIVY